MSDIVYVVIGRTGNSCEVWGVAAYEDEESARKHSQQAAAETKRIQSNIKRATTLRGKPFPEEKLARFRAGNRYDPNMRLEEEVSYEVAPVPLMEDAGV